MVTTSVNPIHRALNTLLLNGGRSFVSWLDDAGEDCCVFATITAIDQHAVVIESVDTKALISIWLCDVRAVARLGCAPVYETAEEEERTVTAMREFLVRATSSGGSYQIWAGEGRREG
jgi:hypothetical protein